MRYRLPLVLVGLCVLCLALSAGASTFTAGVIWQTEFGAGFITPEMLLTGLAPAVSADGRYVVYPRYEVAGETDSLVLTVFDRVAGTNEPLPLPAGYTAAWAPSVSADGRRIACLAHVSPGFALLPPDAFTPGPGQALLVYDRSLPAARAVMEAPPSALYSVWAPAISADGRYVAFATSQPLTPDDTDTEYDEYLYDWDTESFLHLSAAGWTPPGVSANGNRVAYATAGAPWATPATLFLWDRLAGLQQIRTWQCPAYPLGPCAITADGGLLAVAMVEDGLWESCGSVSLYTADGDFYGLADVRMPGLNQPMGGQPAWPSLSADGRLVAYSSNRDPFTVLEMPYQVLLRDFTRGTNRIVSLQADGYPLAAAAGCPALSADGAWLAYSWADPQGAMGVSLAPTGLGPPLVVETDPTQGSSGPPRLAVTAAFSEPLAALTVNGSTFTLAEATAGAIAGQVSLNPPGMLATFTATRPLAPGAYTATLHGGDTGIRDASGQALAADYTWTFTIAQGPLAILAVSPADTAIGRPPSTVATVTFNQPVVPATLESAFTLTGESVGTVAGAVTYDPATLTGAFTPDDPLAYDIYHAIVKGGPTGVQAVAGGGLADDYEWGFVVPDGTPPTVRIISPANGAVVKGTIEVQVAAADDSGQLSVQAFLNNWPNGSSATPPYTVSVETLSAPDGPALITVVAIDKFSNLSAPAAVMVTVDNTTYDDVPRTHPYWGYIEAITRERITSGCSQTPRLYCPDAAVTRGQMAVFICRAAGWAPYNKPTPTFADVRPGSGIYGYVEEIYRRGVTGGCGGTPLRFCPDTAITRGQLAVFLCRAAGLTPLNPATPTFSDVPATNPQYRYIEAVHDAGIMEWCATSPLRFCPGSAVKRGPMAAFLCRAFHISMY